MMMLLKNNSSSSFYCFIPKPASIYFLLHLNFSSSFQNQNPPPKPNFITDYLISSCGFSSLKAATASKRIGHLTSCGKPDSVRHFFKHLGFTNASIRILIGGYPAILCADVDQTLKPNINALLRLGFTEHQLQKFIPWNPHALILSTAIPRVDLWKNYLEGDVKKLSIAFTRNRCLINLDIDKNVLPKISLLKEYGFSDTDIRIILVRHRSFIIRSINAMEALLKKTQEMGFQLGSKMFLHGLSAISRIGPDMFTAKMELFKSFGWSEGEFLAAFQKFPFFVLLAEENVRLKMEFLMERAGCTQPYIASRPVILAYSLQKRLLPRHRVLKMLKSEVSVGKDWDFYSTICLPDKKFVETIIVPFEDEVPTLYETYVAACAGEISL